MNLVARSVVTSVDSYRGSYCISYVFMCSLISPGLALVCSAPLANKGLLWTDVVSLLWTFHQDRCRKSFVDFSSFSSGVDGDCNSFPPPVFRSWSSCRRVRRLSSAAGLLSCRRAEVDSRAGSSQFPRVARLTEPPRNSSDSPCFTSYWSSSFCPLSEHLRRKSFRPAFYSST